MNNMIRSVSRYTKERKTISKCYSCGTKQSIRYIVRMHVIDGNTRSLKRVYLCDKCAKYIL